MRLELKKGVSLEVSDDTPMFNPHRLPLTEKRMHVFGGALSLVNNISEISLGLLPLVVFR